MKTERAPILSNSRSLIPRSQSGWWVGIFILCLTGSAFAVAAGSLRGRGSFTGQATLTPLAGAQVELQIDVVGNVTHLGKCAVRIHSIADFSGPVPTPMPPTTGVITAANGDTIAFGLRWTVQEVSPGVFETSGPFDITGGTGRFKNASGGGDYRGLVDTNNGNVTAEMLGKLIR